MDEVFDNIHSCNSNDLEDFLRLKLEMEPREDKYNEKKKENEKDVKKRYNKQYRWCNDFCLAYKWLKGILPMYIYIYVKYIMDSHHTNKT